MATAVIMPKQGLLMTEGTILKWFVNEGDKIEVGDPLFEMETDKLAITIEAQEAGTILKIVEGEGAVVPITEMIAIIGEPGEDISEMLPADSKDNRPKTEKAAAGGAQAATKAAAEEGNTSEKPGVKRDKSERVFITPRAKILAAEKGIDYYDVNGTGADGLIIEKDILEYLSKAPVQREPVGQTKATPLAARIAEINDINISGMQGSGERGKVTRADVEAAVGAKMQTKATPERGERLVPLTGIRKIIADKMTASLREMAQANHRMRVDVTEITRLRNNLKNEDIKVSFSDIIVKVVAKALTEFPEINSSFTNEGILVKEYVNVGIAVAAQNGLIVPVVKDADLMSLNEIAAASAELVEKARTGKLLPDDYTGGTFTVTNLGMFDIDEFTAIINPPESAILAVGKISKEPVVEDDSIVIKPIMTLSLTYDHRVIDGAPAAQFLQRVKQLLQNPYLLL